MELGLRYAETRIQFGQPIINFPRVADKIAMMAAEIMTARQLTYLAAREKDEGKRCDLEAGMAKLLAARVAWAAADNAVQIHGGNGFALEYPILAPPVRRPHPLDFRGRGGNPGAGHRSPADGSPQLRGVCAGRRRRVGRRPERAARRLHARDVCDAPPSARGGEAQPFVKPRFGKRLTEINVQERVWSKTINI